VTTFASAADRTPSRRHFSAGCLLLAALALVLPLLHGRAATAQSSAIKTLFVEPADATAGTAAVDQRLARRLEKGSGLRVVADKASADAVLRVKAVVWPMGSYIASTRSNTVSAAEYQGYASADLSRRGGQPLWSYLATPSRFHLAGVTDDLGDQLSDALLAALKNGFSSSPEGGAATPGNTAALRVGGATFPEPLYRKWFQSYAEHVGGKPAVYAALGSVAGVEQLIAGKLDMAASDLTGGADGTGAGNGLLRFPTVVGGVVPIYNVPGLTGDLRFTPEVLAEIYAGEIRKWNDPRIRRWNKASHLPNAEIEVVHRSDGSGTSFVWTSFLSAADDAWKIAPGPVVAWPVGRGEPGNEGVAARVASTRNAIGYVELTFAVQQQISYGSVRNPAGHFIRADIPSLTFAALGAGPELGKAGGAEASLLNQPGPNAYPIATFTYFVVPGATFRQPKGAAIAEFLRWMLTSGQKQCASLGYAPLPAQVAEAELKQLGALK